MFVFAFAGLVLCATGQVPPPVLVNFTVEGDVTLGGMVPFHFGSSCQGPLGRTSVEAAETIVFTVRQVNERSDLLPNLTLGFDIRETCYNEDMTLLSVLSLLSSYSHDDPVFRVTGRHRPPATGNLIGIIGTAQSASSLAAAKPINLYGVPMISYSATSDELSDKDRFPYFLRTVPPDRFQARAIMDILVRYNWIYVGLIYSLNTYGILGTQELLSLADKEGVCIAFSIVVRENAAPSEIQEIVQKITTHHRAKVLVMFGEFVGMYTALQIYHNEHPGEKRTLLCSDAFGQDLHQYDILSMIQGSIKVKLDFQKIPAIQEYFSDVLKQSGLSPWFAAFRETWMTAKNCSDISTCPISFTGTWMPIYKSVYAFAYALDDMLRDLCPEMTVNCVTLTARNVTGRDLLPYLRNVTFQGPDGEFHFDSDGDPAGAYLLSSVGVDQQGEIVWHDIGHWDSHFEQHSLKIDDKRIEWPGIKPKAPISVCRDECQPGYIEVPEEEKCCWTCRQCVPNEKAVNNECIPCPSHFWPSEDFTTCQPIVPTIINLKNPIILVLLILCGLGVLLALVSLTGMFIFRKHPLIKATGREVSLVTLLGTLLAYLTIFPFLDYPTEASCAVGEAMVSLGFTLTYAPTLLKVNRICRIFQAGKKSTKPPRFVRPRDQVLLVVLLTAIQVVIVGVSGITGNLSKPQLLMPEKFCNYMEIYCLFRSGFVASCMYNLLLILACCYYAFKTRKVPSNYNESKFIAVSVYSTLVLCLAAVPVYATATIVLQKVATLCMAVLLNAYLTLVCVYLPKLYAARFVKDVVLLRCSNSTTGENSTRVHPLPGPSTLGEQSQGLPSVNT
ncbi:metabotropic glutamate receptor 5-like [Patiria miniata]|uniref:G-protein coupled receptors family 3 profile domain-containing protein n=1 Tax=Patiria miniata TaxID=46514 RepID=A0A914B3P3_PATMI|nr:metabotropic glutamate receptor 5-like [Patiria miniata]